LAVTGATNNTFTITTNASDETITVTATNTELITNLTKKRSAVAADGWTIGFDVTENTTTSARSGNIEVTIGGIKKTISVSQVGRYVNNPVPASFPDLAADGVTNNAFILETNSTATVPTSLTTTDSSMITSLTAVRSVKDAAKGIYLWTVTFNVTANKLSSARSATVSITIGGITKTVGVTQLAPWNGPPTDMSDDLTNCYMVAPGGTVTIPITRAITVGGMSASASATVSTLWDDNAVISGSPTLSGSGASRTITVRTTSEPGNAVVALKDASGTIFWSWHVWVVNYNPNTGTTYTINGYMFMDRDIGATRADGNQARGLLYQWGRKDPFPSAISGSAGQAALGSFYIGSYEVTNPDQSAIGIAEGILESIRKPTTFFSFKNFNYYDWLPKNVNTLWNNKTSRSVYDPCPKGWRVADFTNILLTFPYYAKTRQYDTYDETDGPGFGTVTLYGERWHVMIYTPDYIQTCYAAYWTSSAMAIWYLPHRYWSNRGEWARANGLRIRCMQK
jgi:hypothetical protein